MARCATSRPLIYGVEDVAVMDFDTAQPSIRFRLNADEHEVRCDFVAGCAFAKRSDALSTGWSASASVI